MGKPAARVGDMHVCPMMTPGTPPIPHVGGPLLPPGVPTVLIGGMPAAVMGGMGVCVGPPDSVVLGSMGVMIGGQPAARMGDMCAHGGTIVAGLPTVLIGETSPGAAPVVVVAPNGSVVMNTASSAVAEAEMQRETLMQAAKNGTPFCEKCEKARRAATRINDKKQGWIEVALVDAENNPVPDERYRIDFPDGSYVFGATDENGKARIEGFDPGTCKISFPDLDGSEWGKV